MQIVVGVVLLVISAATFWRSLPRDGRTARFVGTEWEAYVVSAIISTVGIGAVLVLSGVLNWND